VAPIPQISSVRFRSATKLSQQDAAKREGIVTDIALWLRDFNELEKMLKAKSDYVLKDIRQVKKNDRRKAIIKMSELARERLGLEDDEPINDICGLVEKAGIKIHLIKSDLKKFFGLSVLEHDGGPAICVNVVEGISVERQIFTVAHELGHLLLHRSSFNVDEAAEKIDEEKEADIFAGYFLIPEAAFRKAWTENKGLHWVDNVLHMKRIFKVSYQAILRRLEDEGVQGNLRKEFATLYPRMYGHDLKNYYEPKALEQIDFIEDRLKGMVRDAIEREEITVSRAAEILNISVNDMRELINAWARV